MGRSVKVGDTLEIKEMKGTVETISLRSTTIRDDNGVLSNIPNSILTNNTYLQYNKKERHRVDLIVGIDLNIDIEMPGVSFTMEIISPASALNSVDFPIVPLCCRWK